MSERVLIQFHVQDVILAMQESGPVQRDAEGSFAYAMLSKTEKRQQQYVNVALTPDVKALEEEGVLRAERDDKGRIKSYWVGEGNPEDMTEVQQDFLGNFRGRALEVRPMQLWKFANKDKDSFIRYRHIVAEQAEQILIANGLVTETDDGWILAESPQGGWDWFDKRTPGRPLYYRPQGDATDASTWVSYLS